MKVLVTGGAGYLGSVLTGKLLDAGHEVRVFDVLMYGEPLKHLAGRKGLEIVEGDVRNMVSLIKAFKDIDAVIHLAAMVGEPAADFEPKTSYEINYLATRNIAELCTLYKKRFIFPSTCSVYGEHDESVLTEEAGLIKPISLYGQTKLESEHAIRNVCSQYTIFRLGTLFGYSPRMSFELAINVMTAKAINKEPIQIYGGKQWRPFMHVADAADAFAFALEKDLIGTYNTSWRNFQLEEVAMTIANRFGGQVERVSNKEDRRTYRVNTDKLQATGFKTKRNLQTAMDEIDEGFKSGEFKSYKDWIYNNRKTLEASKELQEKLIPMGLNMVKA
jgi:nucleoside-diphosphate-sugar epimerase